MYGLDFARGYFPTKPGPRFAWIACVCACDDARAFWPSPGHRWGRTQSLLACLHTIFGKRSPNVTHKSENRHKYGKREEEKLNKPNAKRPALVVSIFRYKWEREKEANHAIVSSFLVFFFLPQTFWRTSNQEETWNMENIHREKTSDALCERSSDRTLTAEHHAFSWLFRKLKARESLHAIFSWHTQTHTITHRHTHSLTLTLCSSDAICVHHEFEPIEPEMCEFVWDSASTSYR